MTALQTTWDAGHTLRWHAQGNWALQRSGDTVSAHSGRMALLAHHIWPGDSTLIVDCLHHDLPEFFVGDVPGPGKRDFAALNAALVAAEAAVAARYGWSVSKSRELKFLDRLDAFLWMRRVAPDQAREREWIVVRMWLVAEAWALSIGDLITPLIAWVII